MASAGQPPSKRIRIRDKPNLQRFSHLQPLDGEDMQAVREIYVVTLPHPAEAVSKEGLPLKKPGAYDRAGARDAVLKACAEPEHDPQWLQRRPGFVIRPVPVLKLVVFRDFHAGRSM